LRQVSLGTAPVVAQVPSVIIDEGRRAEFLSPDGTKQVLELQPHEVSQQFDRQELVRAGPSALANAVQELGKALGGNMERTFFEKMSASESKARRTFKAKTPQGAFKEFAEGLRTMDYDFDEEGNPSVFAAVSPQLAELLRQTDTPRNRKIIDQITEKKRNEWLDRESRRRLAD